MPFVRFSRDKRGYEFVYLVHTPTKRGKPGRTRVLYWYRTPPGVRMGRKPFDDDMQRRLEAQHPDVTFDWEAIVATPMPPPDMTEYWRERRRAEKAARLERRAQEAQDAGEPTVEEDAGVDGTRDAASDHESQAQGATESEQPLHGVVAAEGDRGTRKKRRRRSGKRRPVQPAASSSNGGDVVDRVGSGGEAELQPESQEASTEASQSSIESEGES